MESSNRCRVAGFSHIFPFIQIATKMVNKRWLDNITYSNETIQVSFVYVIFYNHDVTKDLQVKGKENSVGRERENKR